MLSSALRYLKDINLVKTFINIIMILTIKVASIFPSKLLTKCSCDPGRTSYPGEQLFDLWIY